MFGEAKIALVLGLGLVIAGAVVFFRHDIVQATTPPDAIVPSQTEAPPTDPMAPTKLPSHMLARPM
jgi:hypothetical protein